MSMLILPFFTHASPEEGTPIPLPRRLYPSQTKSYLDAKAETEESVAVSELQLKREAVKGFDIPGHCFYGDRAPFQVTAKYPLPDSLSSCRVLREGGNGVVLEVRNEFETFFLVTMSLSQTSLSQDTLYTCTYFSQSTLYTSQSQIFTLEVEWL